MAASSIHQSPRPAHPPLRYRADFWGFLTLDASRGQKQAPAESELTNLPVDRFGAKAPVG
ncbi:MAG: hypothetical protein NTZ32_18930 [Planctomycetales bacterium]|nr:hypothetical protein [Planctomycetales bacterium]